MHDDGNLITFDVREPASFHPGAQLFIRDRASPSASERNLTRNVFPDDANGDPPQYDVRDLSSSYDGQKLLFSMRAPEDPNADDQPTWNIWLYDRSSDELRRVIASDITAEAGDDLSPRFLPDGRILFASTRQRHAKAVLLDEGKPQFSALDENRNVEALALHVMNDDGSDIHQISFNQSHDLDPSVLDDGRVVYSRWDNIAGRNRISLYTMNPDGTAQSLLYGVHSHDTGPSGELIDFLRPQELPDGRLLVALRSPSPQTHLGGAPIAIDTAAFIDNQQPTANNAGLQGPAQQELIEGDVAVDGRPSPRGRFASIYPLFDGTDRLLITWSQCRLLDPSSTPTDPVIVPCTAQGLANPNAEEAPPLYGVWMLDQSKDTQQPIVVPEEGFAYSEAIVMADGTPPPVILDKVAGIDLDSDLFSENVGLLDIKSVYDFDGTAIVNIDAVRDPGVTTAAQRPARFLRIEKAVSMPDDDVADFDDTAFGVSQSQLMREIIGYVPIEPDGSVMVKVPANIAFMLSVLDANGRRITQRHQNWLQVKAGEVVQCNGCHTAQSELPHGRPDAEAPSANSGAPTTGSPFPNTEPALFADAGETMAETYARIVGLRNPSVNVVYDDVWTDPALRAKDPSFAYRYADLDTAAPLNDPGCATAWTALCRITINYETHIHPIWGLPRVVLDTDGVTVLADHTCNTCHSPQNAMGAAQVPAGQIDLSDGPSPDEGAHFNSYRELFFQDNEQIVVGGALVDRQVQATDANGNLVFETDANGDLILDVNGNPIPVLVPVGFEPPMSPAGALASPRFFDRFAPGGSHANWLSPAELKLISEWVDVGAQYFNDPFAAPQN